MKQEISGTEILPPEFCLPAAKFQNFTFLMGKILDLTKNFGRKQKQEQGFDAKNQIFVITLWYFDFCFCFLPGLRIALASLGLRHAILWTAYKVTEAKTENGDPSSNDKYMNSMAFF